MQLCQLLQLLAAQLMRLPGVLACRRFVHPVGLLLLQRGSAWCFRLRPIPGRNGRNGTGHAILLRLWQ
jgi:hypothetical protein